ncbi:hypothetical protein QE400_002954 [Xanthomonas sacchari]|uniref:DUF4087 domain-containing protein n=1 Tax=Xanthomonas sacchari TaxID=56458 RepID=UPI0027867D7D|nr:DUF4087 domain-containing protein [Xanthomonas sacchari]MDQ1093541.1 hypothetical protein [Xanthomonas sacchari]
MASPFDPDAFPAVRRVATGSGSAGYGCACLTLRARADTQEMARILAAHFLSLATLLAKKQGTGESAKVECRHGARSVSLRRSRKRKKEPKLLFWISIRNARCE